MEVILMMRTLIFEISSSSSSSSSSKGNVKNIYTIIDIFNFLQKYLAEID